MYRISLLRSLAVPDEYSIVQSLLLYTQVSLMNDHGDGTYYSMIILDDIYTRKDV